MRLVPGASGADAAWLAGAKFHSLAVLVVPLADVALRSAEFVLVPHVHGGHAAHD